MRMRKAETTRIQQYDRADTRAVFIAGVDIVGVDIALRRSNEHNFQAKELHDVSIAALQSRV